MKNTLIIGIVCLLSISFISANYLMDESYTTGLNKNNNMDNGLNNNSTVAEDNNSTTVNEVTNESVNVSDVINASKRFKQYEDENRQLPTNIEIAGQNYTIEQFLYMLSEIIVNTNCSNNSSSVPVLKNLGTAYSKGNNSAGDLDKIQYVNASASIIRFMDATNQAPNFLMSEKLGKIPFNSTVDAFVRVVNYISENNTLPESVHFNATPNVENNVNYFNSSYNTPSSYSGDEWSDVNSLKSRLRGMTYGPDGDCYTFSQLVYDALSTEGYKCGIYQGHTEIGRHRVPYVYIDGTRYWLETCRVVQNGWGSGTDWTVPYGSWVPEYVYVSN